MKVTLALQVDCILIMEPKVQNNRVMKVTFALQVDCILIKYFNYLYFDPKKFNLNS